MDIIYIEASPVSMHPWTLTIMLQNYVNILTRADNFVTQHNIRSLLNII